jgi:nicotinamidase-related amidase
MPDPADLSHAFEQGAARYARIGYARRIGYGARPALVVIDMARAWTLPGGPFYCDGIEAIVDVVRSLVNAAHEREVPVFFTVTAYEPGCSDAGVWIDKIPSLSLLTVGSDACRLDERLLRRNEDALLIKKSASAFHRTLLAETLSAMRVDTVIIAGVTASGCVRHTAEDCVAHGFRPIVVRDAVGDRVPGALEWNLFDIDAKVGDVETSDSVLRYLANLDRPGDNR